MSDQDTKPRQWVRWGEGIVRAIIAAFAGVGVGCVTNHFTSRPNLAYVVSAVATGVVIALLGRGGF
jgi:hypothetical protein